ncbi:hypothetical protein Lser_V15G42974 [Lactuca serriola]
MESNKNIPCCRKIHYGRWSAPRRLPKTSGPILLWVGVDKAFERDIIDAHCKACLYVGINIGGINHEVMPDQWEFHLGSSVGEEI